MILACRDAAKGAQVAIEVERAQKAAGFRPSTVVQRLDLSELASVEQCVADIQASGRPLHILVNNAGVYDLSGAMRCCSTSALLAK